MSTVIKTTFYNTPMLQKALKRRALESEQTISAYIQRAIADAIAEDLADIEAFEERASGPTETYGEFLASLKKDGIHYQPRQHCACKRNNARCTDSPIL